MKEIVEIIGAYKTALSKGKQTALATVVHVEGSSYRRPGARMLVTEDGELTGAISGGCLEGDALRKALFVMSNARAMLVTYDTSDDDDAKLGLGLGCNGIIQVLIEPIIHTHPNNPIQYLERIVAKRQQACLVTLFSLSNKKEPQQGTCLLVTSEGKLYGSSPSFEAILLSDADHVLSQQQSCFKKYMSSNQSLTAFIEFVSPPVSLIIIGAGNDVMPVVKIADVLGWETTVVDGRPAYAKQERFTTSCRVLLSKPEAVLQSVKVDEQTVFVLMTHNYNYDKAMLQALLNIDAVFIGMLGPKKKLQRMLDELQDDGCNITEEKLSRIHSPVGLDIGAETPEEIALSIVAEIKSVLAKRKVTPLGEKAESIHSRSETKIEEVKIDEG